jgi:hypothetical protein
VGAKAVAVRMPPLSVPVGATRPTVLGHLRILRVDHWVKNVFILPGIVAAVALDPPQIPPGLAPAVIMSSGRR